MAALRKDSAPSHVGREGRGGADAGSSAGETRDAPVAALADGADCADGAATLAPKAYPANFYPDHNRSYPEWMLQSTAWMRYGPLL